MNLPASVRIVEVGPRDGLQNESQPIPTDVKLGFIQDLAQAGFAEIEATSFVHPKWVPQLADAAEVSKRLPTRDGLVYTALVPNAKGLERARECGYKRVAVFTAATESFSQENTNRSIAQSLQEFRSMDFRGLSVRAYVSTCFVCPYEGDVQPDQVARVSEQLLAMGFDEISLGDTVGRAGPVEVERLLQRLGSPAKYALHLHDTSGTALANVLVGLQMGITVFDSSAGGLGGCPYAPGASGNLATEDLLYMLERSGVSTGIDREKVEAAAERLLKALGKRPASHQLQRRVSGVP